MTTHSLRAKLRAELENHTEIRRVLVGEQHQADVAGAERAVAAAKARATEAMLETDDPQVISAAKADYRQAQAALDAARAMEGQFRHTQARARDADAAVDASVKAVAEAEGLRLIERFHRLELQALQAKESGEGVIQFLAEAGDTALAARLRSAMATFPANTADDPGKFQRARDAYYAKLARFRDGWREAMSALPSDPESFGPDPEEVA